MTEDHLIEAALLDLAHRCGAGKTFCPSEAARALTTDWRPLLPQVRATAAGLAVQGRFQATQRGRRVDAASAHGPIRLGLAP